MTLPVIPACKGCGECCTGFTVCVEHAEAEHIPLRLLDLSEGSPFMRQRKSDYSCMALNRKTMTCTIYDIRPRVCRTFERGGMQCRRVLGVETEGYAHVKSRPS